MVLTGIGVANRIPDKKKSQSNAVSFISFSVYHSPALSFDATQSKIPKTAKYKSRLCCVLNTVRAERVMMMFQPQVGLQNVAGRYALSLRIDSPVLVPACFEIDCHVLWPAVPGSTTLLFIYPLLTLSVRKSAVHTQLCGGTVSSTRFKECWLAFITVKGVLFAGRQVRRTGEQWRR